MGEFEQRQAQIRNALYGVNGGASAAVEEQDYVIGAMRNADTDMRHILSELTSILNDAQAATQANVARAQEAYNTGRAHLTMGVDGLKGVMTSDPGNQLIDDAEDYKNSLAAPANQVAGILSFDAINAAADGLRAAFEGKQREARGHAMETNILKGRGEQLAADARTAADSI